MKWLSCRCDAVFIWQQLLQRSILGHYHHLSNHGHCDVVDRRYKNVLTFARGFDVASSEHTYLLLYYCHICVVTLRGFGFAERYHFINPRYCPCCRFLLSTLLLCSTFHDYRRYGIIACTFPLLYLCPLPGWGGLQLMRTISKKVIMTLEDIRLQVPFST